MKNVARCLTFNLEGKIDVLHASYSGHAFSPHWHEEYAVGLIDTGVEQFEYRGATRRAASGQVVLMTAGEVHTGEAADKRGFGFRMLYVPESTGTPQPQPGMLFFRDRGSLDRCPGLHPLRDRQHGFRRRRRRDLHRCWTERAITCKTTFFKT